MAGVGEGRGGCTCAFGGQTSTLGALPQELPVFVILTVGLPLGLQLTSRAWLAIR